MKYRFINEHRHEFRVATMCRVYCVWLGPDSMHGCTNRCLIADIEDQHLLGLIRDSYTASGGVYGALRVFGDLREAGESCGKHRVAKIMRSNKIKAVRGYNRNRSHRRRQSRGL